MHSESMGRNAEAGFTLIEVLAAMIILSVGLLGLEALGIGAARMVNLADRQSDYATLASDSLESGLHQLRRGTVPQQFCFVFERSDRLSRTVTFPNPRMATVTVRAIPSEASYGTQSAVFEVSSSVFLPISPGTIANGSPCS